MDATRITVANLQDAAELESLYRESYGALLETNYSADLLQQALPLLCRVNTGLIEAGTYFVAREANERIVGGGGWSFSEPGSINGKPGHAHLRHFAILPDKVRCGIGRSLFEACRTAAHDVRVFECISTRTAVPFYRALGFRTVKRTAVPLAADLAFPSIHMIRLPEGTLARSGMLCREEV